MPVKKMHLVLVISGHGYGHAAMTAPLINALQREHGPFQVTVKSAVPLAFLQRKLAFPFTHVPDETDFGMVNRDAFEVDLSASLQRYRDFHQDWPTRVRAEMAQLVALKADALLSNIAYLPLAAAARLGLPCAAYSCLNWAEILHAHFPDQPGIYAEMLSAYQAADIFIRSEPAMPMAGLDSISVGPIAESGQRRRDELLQTLGLPQETRLVLATMGGIRTDMDLANWPRIEGLHYLVPDLGDQTRADISAVSTARMGFTDLLRSVDLLLTKPGYGSFTEAALNRTPVLYVERPNWPEHRYLCRWLERHLPCRAITRQQLTAGAFAPEMLDLLQEQVSPEPPAQGLAPAVALLAQHLKLA